MERQDRRKRAAIYCRVSSAGQEAEGSSLQTQETKCREYAAQSGYTIDESLIYREVYSGTQLWDRPLLSQLREAIRAKSLDVVVAYAIDRLSRDPVHLGVIISEEEHLGTPVEFVTENIDDTPEGQLIRFVKGYAARVEHEKIKERTMRGKLARVQSGKLLPASKPLFGYHWRDATKGALKIDEVTAPIVRRMYREIAGGKTLGRVAAELTAEGIPTPTGRSPRWYGSAIRVILHNPAYMGQAYAWGLRRSTKDQSQSFDATRAIALPEGTIPALVGPVTWHSVQETLTRNKQRATRNAREPEAALLRHGFATCGHCGARLGARPRSKGGYDYVCGSYRLGTTRTCVCPTIVTHALDRAVWEYATDIIMKEDVIANELTRLRTHDPSENDLAAIDRLLASVTRQQDNISRAISMMDDAEGAGLLVAQLKDLTQRVRTLSDERIQVEQRRAAWEEAQQNLNALEEWRQRVATNLDALTYDGRRRALDALGVHATLYAASESPRWSITASIPMGVNIVNTTS